MKAQVARELGMEGAADQSALLHHHHLLGRTRCGLAHHHDAGADLNDARCSDEDGLKRGTKAGSRHLGLEREPLAAVAIAANRDVQTAKAPLVTPPVEDPIRKQHKACARPERGSSTGRPLLERLSKPGQAKEQRHRRGFTAREHERLDAIEISGALDQLRFASQSTQRCDVLSNIALEGEDSNQHDLPAALSQTLPH